MADLLTHYVSARVAGLGVRDRSTFAIFALGVFFPDLIKILGSIRYTPHLIEIPSHTPFGLIFACGAASQLFADGMRNRAFAALYLGSLLHLFLDSMKAYLGSGSIFLLHPFSLETFEGGLYRSEDVFLLLPFNLAILGVLWLVNRRRVHR